MKFNPLTEAEAQKKIKICTDPKCPLGDYKVHKIFYDYEKKKLMGNNVLYCYEGNCSMLDSKENLEVKETTYDEYGNKYHHMVKKND